VVGFAHDWAAGAWGATVLAVWWIHRSPVPDAVAPFLAALMRQFFWIGVGCVVVVLATGAGRTFTYVENWYGEDAEKARRRALAVKHVVLVAVFGAGTWWMGSMAFR